MASFAALADRRLALWPAGDYPPRAYPLDNAFAGRAALHTAGFNQRSSALAFAPGFAGSDWRADDYGGGAASRAGAELLAGAEYLGLFRPVG